MRVPNDQTSTLDRDLARLRSRLGSRLPILRGWRWRHAARKLVLHRERPQAVPLLVEALEHIDASVASTAHNALASLKSDVAIDALCEAAIQDPHGAAARICIKTGMRPRDDERASLFLFLTRQMDAYFDSDCNFQNLRLEYERGCGELRQQVLEIVRGGDRRCIGFFAQRKPLAECSDSEIKAAVRSFIKHQDWHRLFCAIIEVPLVHGIPALRVLGRANWQPDDALQRELLQDLLDCLGDLIPPTPRPAASIHPLIDGWLREGRDSALASESISVLLERLDSCEPVEGVRIVGALAGRLSPLSDAAAAVEEHGHWLVRLAGYLTGVTYDVTHDEIIDPVGWVGALPADAHVLLLPPSRATPSVLERLAAAPPEAWRGSLGVARGLLQLVLTYRMTTGSFEPLVVEVDYDVGEFEPVDELELAASESDEHGRDETAGGSAGR